MARLGITKNDVFEACKTLLKDGVPLTIANVREELGTGSYTTLLPHIDEFKKSQQAELVKAEGTPLIPPEITNLGQKLTKEVWEQATEAANKRITAITSEFELKFEELAQELKLNSEERDSAVKNMRGLEQEIETKKIDYLSLEKVLYQKDGEIHLLKTQAKEKDLEIKALIERTARAEKELQLKSERK